MAAKGVEWNDYTENIPFVPEPVELRFWFANQVPKNLNFQFATALQRIHLLIKQSIDCTGKRAYCESVLRECTGQANW